MLKSYTSIILFIIILFVFNSYATTRSNSIELKNSGLTDAIRLIAHLLNMNVIVSSSIKNEKLLDISFSNPFDTFNMLLKSHGLVKCRSGNIWLIAPINELMKLKQEELKWEELTQESLPLLTQIWQIKYAKAEDIAKLIKGERTIFLSKRGRVIVDNRTNILCIQDVLIRIQKMRVMINHLDVPVRQIAIKARLISIDCDYERELGIHFSMNERVKDLHSINKKSERGEFTLAIVKLADYSFLDIKLAALENSGHAELISNPSLFAGNLQTASIEAGEEVPYQETSEGGGTSIAFKKAVLGLKVTPQILPQKNILLHLQINQDRPSNKMVQGMPTISTRQITTSVLAKSGQTIVLGGIYEENTEKGSMNLPIISRIPLLRWLFQQHHTRKNKRELLIFVTPEII